MKKKILIAGMIMALGTGIPAYGATDNVNWLDAEKAEFLENNSDFIIYTRGDHGEGIFDMQGRDMIKYGQYISVEEGEGFFRTIGENIFYDEENPNNYPKIHNIFYKGGIIFPTEEYEYLSVVKEGLILAQKKGKLGFLKNNGKPAIDFKYDYAEDFNHGVTIVGQLHDENIMYGAMDKTGNVVIPLKYNYVSKLNEGHFLFAKEVNGALKYGLLDKNGKENIPAKYDGMFLLEGENMVVMLKEGEQKKFGIVDINDKSLLGIEYDFIGQLSENTYLIGKGKNFGYIDAKGDEIVSLKFDEAMDFSEDSAAVQMSGKWGYINKQGKEIIAFKFDGASKFKDGYGIVKVGDKYGIIDKSGNFAVDAVYDSISKKDDGNYVLTLGKQFALMDKTLNTLLSDYEYINSSGGNYLVKKDGKFGIIWNGASNSQNTAIKLSTFNMEIDKAPVKNNAYLINDSNYIRLRDMAFLLKNTGAKFSIEYVEELKRINIEKNKDYQLDALTAIKAFGEGDAFSKSKDELYIDGKVYNLDSYNVNGNNYYKLRDLGIVLGFSVDWDSSRKLVLINTEK